MSRAARDVAELRAHKYCVQGPRGEKDWERVDTFSVWVQGPENSPYAKRWISVLFDLPLSTSSLLSYPFLAPRVGFRSVVWHPNVCMASGFVCVDVLSDRAGRAWSSTSNYWNASRTLLVVVEQVIPLLLQNPEPSSPLNCAAAKCLSYDVALYTRAARAMAEKYLNDASAIDVNFCCPVKPLEARDDPTSAEFADVVLEKADASADIHADAAGKTLFAKADDASETKVEDLSEAKADAIIDAAFKNTMNKKRKRDNSST